MIKSKLDRVDESLIRIYEEDSSWRVKNDIDKKTISFRRYTKSLATILVMHPEIREIIRNAIIEDDRRNNNVK